MNSVRAISKNNGVQKKEQKKRILPFSMRPTTTVSKPSTPPESTPLQTKLSSFDIEFRAELDRERICELMAYRANEYRTSFHEIDPVEYWDLSCTNEAYEYMDINDEMLSVLQCLGGTSREVYSGFTGLRSTTLCVDAFDAEEARRTAIEKLAEVSEQLECDIEAIFDDDVDGLIASIRIDPSAAAEETTPRSCTLAIIE